MKQLSLLLYRILRLLSRWFLRILYPGMMVEGQEYVDREGPYMLAANHPNTLIDPLIQGIHMKRRMHFMANAGLFANPLMYKFLRFAGVIPIARPGIDGKAGEKIDNNNSFELAYQLFEAGDIMFVAPEGGSYLERRLRAPLKMGTAKMALTVEARNDWQLGMSIVPAGGNYEAPTRCFSRAFVRFGPPIHIADYKEEYEANPRRALVSLTKEIGKRMADLVIDTKDKTEEHFFRPLDRSLQNDKPLLVADHHYRLQKLLKGVRELPEAEREALQTKANRYEKLLKDAKIDDAVLSSSPVKLGSAGLWLGLPLFFWGALNHLPLIAISDGTYKKLGVENNYAATVRGLVGTIALPILYILQSWLFSFIFPGGWAWLYLLTLPVFGLFALAYYTTYYPYWTTFFNNGKVSQEMRELRRDIRTAVDTILDD